MGSDSGGDFGNGGGREIKLEKMSSQASGGTVEIIAPTFWLVGTRDEGAGSAVELGDGNGETSGEDTSDEAFERRHTVSMPPLPPPTPRDFFPFLRITGFINSAFLHATF